MLFRSYGIFKNKLPRHKELGKVMKLPEHCGCDKGHPEIKPVPVVKTIKKIVKQAREKKKYK